SSIDLIVKERDIPCKPTQLSQDLIVKERDIPCKPTQLSQEASIFTSCFSCNHRDIGVR
ncbi:hypothetical protein HAX54_029904, partial [Datura stramonium]|nr:hypothetical protein [Datura stramonium]